MYTPTAQATSDLSRLYDAEIKPPRRDVAESARAAEGSRRRHALSVPLTVTNTPQAVQTAEVIQSMAAEAGFAVQVNAMEFGAALAAVRGGDFAMTLGGWSGLLTPTATSGASCIAAAR